MHENIEARQLAILVGVDLGEYDMESSLAELEELANTAGADVVAKVTQKRDAFDKGTCIGAGKLQEIALYAENTKADLLIFDHELSASQIRNIENICKVSVVDRTMLILDIFAGRARTAEGRLQVELAQQKYRLSRLAGLGTSLSRLGGGIGTRGPGETKLETDRRHIRSRITILEEKLDELSKRRNFQRIRRKKDGIITVAIVGYTNVGKSTLLNALTDAGVLAEDMLFATLDPTARALLLPDGRSVMLIDTVGLVRRLPHNLVEAFKSTLEEASNADLLLNMCDISSDEMQGQIEVTEQLFRELGVEDTPIITVLNKCDRVNDTPLPINDYTVLLSAKTRFGFDNLLNKIAKALAPTSKRMKLLIPYSHTAMINEIRIDGKIFSEEYLAEGTLLDALVDIRVAHKVEEFEQE